MSRDPRAYLWDVTTAAQDIASQREVIGTPISQFDAMIAAVTLAHGANLATRNTKDFTDIGMSLVNPRE